MPRRRTASLTSVVLVGAAIAAPGVAETPGGRTVDAATAMLKCRETADDTQRLACFDREAAALDRKVTSGGIVVVDKAEVRAAQRAKFGLAPPGLEVFAGKDGERLSTVTTTVANVSFDRFGKLIVTLADHSRWRQIDDYPLGRTPRAGQTVVISRAALGSFMMSIGGQIDIRVRRTA